MKTIEQIAEELKNRYPETPQAAYESAKSAATLQVEQDLNIFETWAQENFDEETYEWFKTTGSIELIKRIKGL